MKNALLQKSYIKKLFQNLLKHHHSKMTIHKTLKIKLHQNTLKIALHELCNLVKKTIHFIFKTHSSKQSVFCGGLLKHTGSLGYTR